MINGCSLVYIIHHLCIAALANLSNDRFFFFFLLPLPNRPRGLNPLLLCAKPAPR